MRSRRDFLKVAAAAGVALPIAACNGSSDQPNKGGAAGSTSPQTAKAVDMDILGAYAFVFNDERTILEVASIKQPDSAENNCNFIHHPMGLALGPGVTIEPALPMIPGMAGDPRQYHALPPGLLTFGGVQSAASGLTGFKKDTAEATAKPPANAAEWNDIVWIPNLGRAMQNWRDRTTSRLRLDAGSLSIKQPGGTMDKACWEFKPATGRPLLPIVESANYVAPLAGQELQLLVDGKQVATLKSAGPLVKIFLGAPSHGGPKAYNPGEAVAFFSMFSELIDSARPCAARPVPVLGTCPGGKPEPGASDGEFCPYGLVVAPL